ncbi:MAG TPA: tRNA pseudouridine(38-40) synthase TruA [Candidatus Gallacutalibacter stercoravium]|nr:tRNA pseudouridine(38-40) synthase TruA [Candidatus Gallacutalibacter stercoravium]
MAVRNLLVTIAFDGRAYHGWQIQSNAVSVQEVFQRALAGVTGEPVDIKGCSRTDTGVHARMFCISVKTGHSIPCERLVAALNRFLPKDIAVLSCREVAEGFHARYSCVGKEYVYEIWNAAVRNPFLDGRAYHYWYPLDVEQLHQSAQDYLGSHDFTSFCTLDSRERENMVRTVRAFSVRREGDLVRMTVEADGFLYNMVRIMVGTLLRIAQGKFAPDCIPGIIRAKDRAQAGPTAPACGLYLNRVFYD